MKKAREKEPAQKQKKSKKPRTGGHQGGQVSVQSQPKKMLSAHSVVRIQSTVSISTRPFRLLGPVLLHAMQVPEEPELRWVTFSRLFGVCKGYERMGAQEWRGVGA